MLNGACFLQKSCAGEKLSPPVEAGIMTPNEAETPRAWMQNTGTYRLGCSLKVELSHIGA